MNRIISRLPIRATVVGGSLVTLVLFSVFVFTYYPTQYREQVVNTLRESLETKAVQLGQIVAFGIGVGMARDSAVAEAFELVRADSSLSYAIVLDTEGNVVASHRTFSHLNTLSPGEGQLLSRRPVLELEGQLHAAAPIRYQDREYGTLVLGFSLEELDNSVVSNRITTAYMALAVLLFGGLLSMYLAHLITAPIIRLRRAADAVTAGHDDVRFNVNSSNEIGVLGRALERMMQVTRETHESRKMEAVGQMAGVVAHDFNNLLTVIVGNTENLLGELQRSDPHRQEAEEISEAANRAASLTQQLLAFSRRGMVAPKTLDLNDVTANMREMLPRLIREDIELVTVFAPALGRVKADSAQIGQVIANLVGNAQEAMPNGGKLIVETANVDLDGALPDAHEPVVPGSYVMLAVSDTGVGMDAETQSHIFEPFFTTKDGGTGLGLATVYGIVKQNGGHICVSSEPGHGSRFKVYLPIVEEAVEPGESGVSPTAPPRGSETLLLVEDEDMVRRVARRVLLSFGYTVLEARDGREALAICRRHEGPIHLVLTDVVMPEMSGRELAEHLAVLQPTTKVLYTSGYTDGAIADHGVLDPGLAFLQKPFTPDALASKVREVLDARRPG